MKTSTLLRFGHVATRYHLTGQRAPLNTMIALTDQCNARCAYCDIPARGRPGLESKALLRLIDELAEAGCARLGFWGGEPLLRPDLGALIDHAHALGLWTSLDTNGYLFPKRAQELHNLDHVVFSLDGFRTNHELNREAGAYDKVMAAIHRAAEMKKPFWTLTVLTRHNLGDIGMILDLAEATGGRAAFQVLHHPPGVASTEAGSLAPEPEALRDALRALLAAKEAGRPVAVSRGTLHHLITWPDYSQRCSYTPSRPRCLAGELWVNIDPEGQLFACSLWPDRKNPPNAVTEGFAAAFERLSAPPCRACLATCFTEVQGLFSLQPAALKEALVNILPTRSAP